MIFNKYYYEQMILQKFKEKNMTIATEISKLQENLANAYSTIEEKGATLPSAQNFDNLATTISSIPSATSYIAGTGIDITNDVISVTSDISTGAALGATAVQPADLASVATSGSYNDLSNKPDLSAKANIDLSNCTIPHIVETYVNGTSWYRVYSDGWCEQGANNQTSDTNGGYTVTFLKPFKDTNYNVTGMTVDIADGTQCVKYYAKSATSIGFLTTNNTQYSSMQFNWQACGYIS